MYAADSFDRTVSDGWGSADTGGSWTLQKGAAADESVNGSSGVFAVPADVFTNSEQVLDLPSTSVLDYQGSFDVTWMEDVNTLEPPTAESWQGSWPGSRTRVPPATTG